MNTEYDVVVIGAGPAGENAAARAAAGGLEAAIVERELVGGECSYYACMPSKALLRPGEALAAARRVPGAAQAITGEIDIEAALARRDALASNWDDGGQVDWLDGVNVNLIRGHGRLAGERTVDVEHRDGTVDTYEARAAVVIATGSGAARPAITGLGEVRAWDNRDVTTTKELPRRLTVIGGGVVGSEMAQAWKWLGAREVTIIEMEDRLLPREEPFVGVELAAAFQRMGITVLTDCKVIAVGREGVDGPATVIFDEVFGGVEADEILVAVGRRPLTADVGLDRVGLEPGSFIEVNDHMQAVAVPGGWLYAVGDVNGRALLTHTGKYQARAAGDHIAGKDASAWSDKSVIPRVVFTDPQIAAVGLTERQARDSGIAVRTVQHNTGHVAGAAALGRGIRGTSQLVIDEDREVIVGATFVGPGVGEMLHAATIAIVGEVTLDRLWHAVPAFPTMSEIWLRFLESYGL
ncbi:MAG: dihydrolipoyl dehydrogenase family protein [Acidimicrobiia bacterium]